MSTTKQEIDESAKRELWGHPIGLWVLFTTEMWERFCYYGMRAFLVMYLIYSVRSTNPGFGWSEKSAYELYGWFTSMVYVMPLLGGYIADRILGQHRSVFWGGVLIVLGEFTLFLTEFFRQYATESITLSSAPLAWLTFMLGLFLIVLGTGFFKPCISIMVGQLYPKHDSRRDVAFTIFYMGINLGALIAPLVAGTVAEKVGWHWGFLIASIGMVFGLFTYSIFRPRYLGHIGMLEKEETNSCVSDTAGTPSLPEPTRRPLSRKEIDRIAVILVLSSFCIAFWAVFEQAGSSLTTFAKMSTNRQVPNSLAKAFPPPFLPNEDEMDAFIAFENAKLSVLGATSSLNAMRKNVDSAETLLLEEGKNSPIILQLADIYNRSSLELQQTISSADFAIRRAQEARQKAGFEPLKLTVPTMSSLLKEGQQEAKELEKKVAEKFALVQADPKNKDLTTPQLNSRKTEIARDIEKESRRQVEEQYRNQFIESQTLYTFPATWYQSVNPIGIVLFAPLFALLWNFLAWMKIEPSTPVKFGTGLLVLSFGFLFMIGAAIQAEQTGGNAGAYWLLITYVLCTWGELCLSPVGLSMVSRLAPTQYASFLMGVWLFSSAIANYISAKLAAVFGSNSLGGGGQANFFFGASGGLADFFLILTLIPFLVSLVVFFFAGKLRKMMHEED